MILGIRWPTIRPSRCNCFATVEQMCCYLEASELPIEWQLKRNCQATTMLLQYNYSVTMAQLQHNYEAKMMPTSCNCVVTRFESWTHLWIHKERTLSMSWTCLQSESSKFCGPRSHQFCILSSGFSEWTRNWPPDEQPNYSWSWWQLSQEWVQVQEEMWACKPHLKLGLAYQVAKPPIWAENGTRRESGHLKLMRPNLRKTAKARTQAAVTWTLAIYTSALGRAWLFIPRL